MINNPTTVVNLHKAPYDIYIGRPSIWGNPFRIDTGVPKPYTREASVSMYREWIVKQPKLMGRLPELKGKTLGCFCKPHACHGDVLVELVLKHCGG